MTALAGNLIVRGEHAPVLGEVESNRINIVVPLPHEVARRGKIGRRTGVRTLIVPVPLGVAAAVGEAHGAAHPLDDSSGEIYTPSTRRAAITRLCGSRTVGVVVQGSLLAGSEDTDEDEVVQLCDLTSASGVAVSNTA